MAKKYLGEIGIKKVMDLSMKLFPNNEITSTEVNDMWSSLNSTPTELDLNYNYTLDKPNNAVMLQKYIGTDPVVTVKSSYDKDNTTYNTKIASNDSSSDNYMFANNETVETVDFEEGVTVGSNINKMFKNCINLRSVNLSNVDLSNVTSVDNTFSGTTNLEKVTEDATNGIPDTVDKSNMFTDSSISDTTETLDGALIGPESELSKWSYALDNTNNIITLNQFSNKTDTDVIVYGAYKKGDKVYKTRLKAKTSSVGSLTFNGKRNIKTITFNPGVDSSENTSLYGMFSNCSNLASINGLENLNTSNVREMGNMFYYCSSLTSLNLSSWDTSNVAHMNNMFSACSSLTSLDLTSFNISKVTNMKYMFNAAEKLAEIKVSRSKFKLPDGVTAATLLADCACDDFTYVD